MRVIMKVLDEVDLASIKGGKEKLGKITMKSPGSDAITVMIFNRDIEEGKHEIFNSYEGKRIITDIECDVRDGQVSYRLAFNAQIVPYDAYVKNAADRMVAKPAVPAPAAKPTVPAPAAKSG